MYSPERVSTLSESPTFTNSGTCSVSPVSGATKPATLETGLTLQVPLFVNVGDSLKVDTRSGEYITRA